MAHGLTGYADWREIEHTLARYGATSFVYGWENVQDWAKGGGAVRVDWVAVTRNAIKKGWARAGYGNWLARRKRPPRTLTPELIEKLVETRREEFGP